MKTIRYFMLLSLLLLGFKTANAEDIDIFLTPPSTAVRPNVLIIVDNTANWSSSFTSEMQALASVVGGLTDKVNVGIMMFSETGGRQRKSRWWLRAFSHSANDYRQQKYLSKPSQ